MSILSPETDAILQHMEAQTDLLMALICHLYDKKLIDAQAIGVLLQDQLDKIATDPNKESVRKMLVAQIKWLDRLGTGLKDDERL